MGRTESRRRRRRGGGEDLPQLRAGGAFEAGLLESGTAEWAWVVLGMEGMGRVSGVDACLVGSSVVRSIRRISIKRKGEKRIKSNIKQGIDIYINIYYLYVVEKRCIIFFYRTNNADAVTVCTPILLVAL